MSNRREREAEDQYEAENDPSPVSGTIHDDSYVRLGQEGPVPVQKDDRYVEDPIDPATDEQLGTNPPYQQTKTFR